MITKPIYVVDTSYLLELYRVDGCSEEIAHKAVSKKFQNGLAAKGQFFVPVPVLFELANHIADVPDATRRKHLAAQLHEHIQSSIVDAVPWVITHANDAQSLGDLLGALKESAARFASEFATQKLGLTDTAVILEAERLRSKHPSNSLLNYQIHIWTRHQELKSREPDSEVSPFV
jgi:hypothetical protein